MGKLLEQLYAGEIQPCERISCDNEEYKALCRESLEEIERFSKKLDVDMREEWSSLIWKRPRPSAMAFALGQG